MSKRRKYDMKNKRSFIIIIILSIIIIGIFSLFIYKYASASKIQYVIEAGTVIQDVEKNYITVDDDAVLRIRWNDNYYLEYKEEKITLGKKVVAYNTITGGMKLYGNFYEIAKDGKIIEHRKETVLANTTIPTFYKLDDREYLLIDSKIYSDDYSIEANSYLLVELDKAGNAKLSNNKINLKTISPTILVTSGYRFDIANELLNFGEYDIDLKKIIGSTNQYNPDTESDEDDNDNDDVEIPSVDNSLGGDGSGEGATSDGVINNIENGDVPSLGELLDKVKMTSIIRIVEGLNQIDVDYVIYDPYNEYTSVYVEVVSQNKIDVIHLSKTETHLTINDLSANTNYRLNFIYTTNDVSTETGEETSVPHTFEQFDLKTKMPEYSVSVYKISKVYNTLTYKVNLQDGFSISKVNVDMTFNYDSINEETGEVTEMIADLTSSVDVDGTGNYVIGTFDISEYDIDQDTLLKLTIKSVVSGEVELPINSTYSFRFGR